MDDDDAKAMRAAFLRAKRGINAGGARGRVFKGGRGSGRFGGYSNYGGNANPYGMSGMGGALPQMFYPAPRMAMAPQMAPQYPPAPMSYGGGQPAAPYRATPSLKTCFKCGMPGHFKDGCPNGPPRV